VDSLSVDFSVTTPGTYTGTYGTLTLNTDGTYSYVIDDLNAAVDGLNVGDSLSESFNYTMSDNNPIDPKTSNSTLTITLHVTNDAPVAVADLNSGDEGNEAVPSVVITVTALPTDTHVDSPSVDFSVTTPGTYTGTYGTLTINADGTYSY